jgi:hypothetical protein
VRDSVRESGTVVVRRRTAVKVIEGRIQAKSKTAPSDLLKYAIRMLVRAAGGEKIGKWALMGELRRRGR